MRTQAQNSKPETRNLAQSARTSRQDIAPPKGERRDGNESRRDPTGVLGMGNAGVQTGTENRRHSHGDLAERRTHGQDAGLHADQLVGGSERRQEKEEHKMRKEIVGDWECPVCGEKTGKLTRIRKGQEDAGGAKWACSDCLLALSLEVWEEAAETAEKAVEKKHELARPPMRGGKTPAFWLEIGLGTQVMNQILQVMTEVPKPEDAGTMEACLGKELWEKARRLDLIREFPGHGTPWKPWAFTEAGGWLKRSVKNLEKFLEPMRLLLLAKEQGRGIDWEWVVAEIGEETGKKLTENGFVKVNENEHGGRVWDGEGKGWTPWNITESGKTFAETVEAMDRIGMEN